MFSFLLSVLASKVPALKSRQDYIDNGQVALHNVNLMASDAQSIEEPLSLHNGSTTTQLSILKPCKLKPIY